jgi:hypothetical protein
VETVADRIATLLNRMRETSQSDPDHGVQIIHPPIHKSGRIATLKPGLSRELSPMLKARFEYASDWENARLSKNWLSLSQIARPREISILAEWIDLRAENCYGDDPPGCVEPGNCAVFAFNPFEPEETYLIWREGEVEPKVWEYFGADSYVFDNLERYLEYIVGDRDADDSNPEPWDGSDFEIGDVAKAVTKKPA